MGNVITLYSMRAGLTYNGRVAVSSPEPEEILFDFFGYSFPKMLTALAAVVQKFPEATATWVSEDKPGLSPYLIPAEELQLLRTDPVAIIRKWNIPPMVIDLRKPEFEIPAAPAGLRVGFASFADTFGEHVYCRASPKPTIECPGCGRWIPVDAALTVQCPNANCHILLKVQKAGEQWWSVSTRDLLNTGKSNFFLPRVWNTTPWISLEDLRKKYEHFVQEKNNV